MSVYATTCPSHLLYLPSRDLWIGATKVRMTDEHGQETGELGWRFKNSLDACLWLSEPGTETM